MIWAISACVFVTAADIDARNREPTPVPTPVDPLDMDLDGDGFVGRQDCNDADEDVFPGQDELPNQVDDDCDGAIDEGTIFYDDDGDGFCEQLPCAAVCGLDDCSGDCDDTHAVVYPGAPELCDGLPNDCTWDGDEHDDRDGDGWSLAQGDPDDRDVSNQPTDITTHFASMACRIARIEPGTFTMGCDEDDCDFEDGPEHDVTISYPLLVMETEVLRGPWNRILGAKNWAFPTCGDSCPVTRVSWYEAFEMADQLNDFEGLPRCEPTEDPRTCSGWRLPTEAEWAWAARGTSSDRFAGSSNGSLAGWIQDNSGQAVHPARLKLPNQHGIYDLTGNVWEWVWDREGPYAIGAITDPVLLEGDPGPGSDRRTRGASANTPLYDAYVTTRGAGDADGAFYADQGDAGDTSPNNPFNYHGFRLVRRAP